MLNSVESTQSYRNSCTKNIIDNVQRTEMSTKNRDVDTWELEFTIWEPLA